MHLRADRDTGECWPSTARLAEDLDCSQDTVRRHVRTLMEIGAVEVVARWRDDGSQSSNAYMLHLERPARHEQGALPLAPVPPSPPESANPPLAESRGLEPEPMNKRTPSGGPRTAAANALWDALDALLGSPATRQERARYGRAVKELVAIGATPQQVRQRGEAARRLWRGKPYGPEALLKHWTMLGNQSATPEDFQPW